MIRSQPPGKLQHCHHLRELHNIRTGLVCSRLSRSVRAEIIIYLVLPTTVVFNNISAYDSSYNGTSFTGMKLAGLINICCGFVLVLTPSNWAEILKDFIR